MIEKQKQFLLPEDALTRFSSQDANILHLDLPLSENKVKRYGFQIGDIGFLIAEKTLSEVMKSFNIYPIPNTCSWFKGLTNSRGNLIPVFDLQILMELTDTESKHTNLLVLDKGINSIGILIDSLPKVCDVTKWKKLSYSPQMPAGLSEYITEVFTVDDQIWIGIDHIGYFESIKEQVAV